MIEIKQVKTKPMAQQCDRFLTKLIQEERRFDPNIKDTYVIQNNYQNKIKQDYNILYLAYIDQVPVGFLFGYWKFAAGDFVATGTAHIDALYVEVPFRNQGVATALMNAFYEWCKKREIGIVEIGVFVENKQAFDLYQKQGFSVEHYYMKKEIFPSVVTNQTEN